MKSDFLIIGAGIVGTTIAMEIKRRFPDQSVVVIEKEADLAAHASGRNSGVLHAGFYYTADSLKARFTRLGNLRLKEFCREHDLHLNECGKLVVATNDEEQKQLDVLIERGRLNGVELKAVDQKEAKSIEPRVKVFGGRALFSPATASADPIAILRKMKDLGEAQGIKFIFECRFIEKKSDGSILTAKGPFAPGFIINAAGLYADQVAHQYGFGKQYQVVPYKGLYLYSNEPVGSMRTHIYPVPDLRNPFLGVHFTLTVDGQIKIGPTAIPALWREQYEGLSHFDLRELATIGWRNFTLLFNGGHAFASMAFEEFQNLRRSTLVEKARRLATGVELGQFRRWGRPGIRAQLVDLKSKRLVPDFLIEKDDKSLHVLNAVSPGWTCSIPFAEYVVDQLEGK